MKKIILFGVLFGLLTNCDDNKQEIPPYRDASTQFIIVDILDRDGMQNMSTYNVEIIDANNLVVKSCGSSENLNFWFCDTIGKYKLGQPIHFDKTR